MRLNEFAAKRDVSVDSQLIQGASGNLSIWGLLDFVDEQLPIHAYPLLVPKGYEFYLDAHRKLGGTIENIYQIPEVMVLTECKQCLTANNFVNLPVALLRNFVKEPDEPEFLVTYLKFDESVPSSWENGWYLELKTRYKRVDPKIDLNLSDSVEELPDLSAYLWIEPAAKIKKQNLFVRRNALNPIDGPEGQLIDENLNELDRLLIAICQDQKLKRNDVLKKIKSEMNKKNRRYDKKGILLNFTDEKRQTFQWNKAGKPTNCCYDTLGNYLSKLRNKSFIQ